MTDEEMRELTLQSAALRGQGRYREAIKVIKDRVEEFNEMFLLAALLEMMYAADEAGFRNEAVGYAQQILDLDPNVPSVKRVLDRRE
jgi:tetratricopeptide (TPR) repeat protein